jgi:mRNA degradation ribonuclease J1/J2
MGPSSPIVKKGADYLPEKPGPDTVRVVPLGGVEEVGRNMFTVETNNDIFVFDVGFQFTSEDLRRLLSSPFQTER